MQRMMVLSGLVLALAAGRTWGGESRQPKVDRSRELRYAAEMAEQGLWREALFRWERVLRVAPDDPKLLNNIAVAKEALGDREGARAAYDRARQLSTEARIATNHDLFRRGDPAPAEAP